MVKAGKKVRKQIRRNKKTPSKQVVKKRMNVREIMLEKMRMGMLVPQQQATPQQVQQNNEMDKLRSQINVAEKGLSDERLKRKALEAERERLKVEKEEEMRLRKQQDDEIQKLKKEYKKKSKEYENDRRFNEKIDDLKEKREDLDQKIQDEEAIGELEARYKHEKKTFDREQEMKKKGEEYFEKYDDLQYKKEQAAAHSEVTQMERSLAAEKAQYEAIKHAAAMAKAEIAKNRVYADIQLQKKKNDEKQAELDAMEEVLKSREFTNSLEEYKNVELEKLKLESKAELEKIKMKAERENKYAEARLNAQMIYHYGTEEEQRVEGFVPQATRDIRAIQEQIVDEEATRFTYEQDNADLLSRSERIKHLRAHKNSLRNKNTELKLAIEAAKAEKNLIGDEQFDKDGNPVLTADEEKLFKEHAKLEIELQKEKALIDEKKKTQELSRTKAKNQYLREQLDDPELIDQIKDIQIQTMKAERDTQIMEKENAMLQTQAATREYLYAQKIRRQAAGIVSDSLIEQKWEQSLNEQIAVHNKLKEDTEAYNHWYDKLYPYMISLSDEEYDLLQNAMCEKYETFRNSDYNVRNWAYFEIPWLQNTVTAYEELAGEKILSPKKRQRTATSTNPTVEQLPPAPPQGGE